MIHKSKFTILVLEVIALKSASNVFDLTLKTVGFNEPGHLAI